MPTHPSPAKIPADPSQWSEKSQRSVAVDFTADYTDITYRCWHCQAESVFSAADQKYTYEVRKANINQQRLLCESCWRQSLQIAADLKDCEANWGQSKAVLKSDKAFLTSWLKLLEEQETYVPYRHDTARKNMLGRLLQNA